MDDKFTLFKNLETPNEKKSNDIFFRIDFDDHGARIDVVDKDLNKIETDFNSYSGKNKVILRYLSKIVDKDSSFDINWEEKKAYLNDNENLLIYLKGADNIVDSSADKIDFSDFEGKIYLRVNENEAGFFKTKMMLKYGEKETSDFRFITSSSVYAGNEIIFLDHEIENYMSLKETESLDLKKDEINKYFTLFLSYYSNIGIDYFEFETIESEIVSEVPSIIFEKVDSENSLFLKVIASRAEFEASFYENYDITRHVLINDLEKKIETAPVEKIELSKYVKKIAVMLKDLKKSLDPEIGSIDYIQTGNLFVVESSLAEKFLHKKLSSILKDFLVYGSEKLKTYKIKTINPHISLSLNSGIEFLEAEAFLNFGGEVIPFIDALEQFNKKNYITLSDGTNAIVNKKYFEKLKRIFKKNKNRLEVSVYDLPIIEDYIDEKIYGEAFKKSREVFLGFNKLKSSRSKAPKINCDLRKYQLHGYRWAKYLQKHKLGGCLADDMGLGKTVQAISLLSSFYPKEKKPSLIIMPRTLLFNWASEFEKFNSDISCYLYHGTSRSLRQALKHNVILTTYEMVRNDIERFKEKEFFYIILDECQKIKNVNTGISRAVMLLNSSHKLALSGTPLENNLGELYALFRFLNPVMFGSIKDFSDNYVIPIQKHGDREILNELKRKIYPYILRRKKSEVLHDLPEKIEQVIHIPMNEKQEKFYKQRKQYYYKAIRSKINSEGIEKSQIFIFQAINELRQIASSPEIKSDGRIEGTKKEVLLDKITDACANNHKCLVFTNYLGAVEVLEKEFEEQGIKYLTMTGATKNRQELVEKFQSIPEIKVFILTLKTGGVGLNLTAADQIFIYDPWWNKSVEKQAIDRSHRIGQDKTVFSYKLITKDTIEEKILDLQEKKSELFENLIGSDGASLKNISEDDIDYIMGV